ncbi:MAG: MFS transporter [Alphaproteobacteria bacterium]|nr:MFS transporter [Alphaproteobacteria bacterium]
MSDSSSGSGGGPHQGSEESGLKGFACFRHRDFRLLFFGKLIAFLALFMVVVAIGYQVYDMTGDPLDLAYIGLAVFAPSLGFAPITGYVSDRYDRRIVLAVCYLAMVATAVLFTLFALSGTTEVWPAFLILVLYGAGRAFYMPCANALLPNLVPVEEFPNAVAWNTSATRMSQIAGPALGGFLYLAGPEVVYATAAVVFAIGLVLVLMIRTRSQPGGKEPISLSTLAAGVGYVWDKKVVLGAISLDLFVVLLAGAVALLPVFAKDILQVGPLGAGLLRSAIAVGGMAVLLALTQISITRNVGKIMFGCVFVFGIASTVFGLSTSFALSLVAMAVLGAADSISVFIRQTLIQVATPDEMRGRVSAVNSVFVSTSNEIGDMRAGFLAAWIGAVPAVVIGGIGSVVIAAVCWKLFPELVNVQRVDRNI